MAYYMAASKNMYTSVASVASKFQDLTDPFYVYVLTHFPHDVQAEVY